MSDLPNLEEIRERIPLPRIHQATLDFIIEFKRENGYSPSIREIGKALGVSSPSTVKHRLRALEDRGAIKMIPNSPRSIQILDSDICPTCGAGGFRVFAGKGKRR